MSISYKIFTPDGVEVPQFVGHNYRPVKVHFISALDQYRNHRRLKVFFGKGVRCVSCPLEGHYVIEAVDHHGNIHVDVYTNRFELMTVDHIIPKSRGGSEEISNKQPMCEGCNSKKGNKLPEGLKDVYGQCKSTS